MRTPEEIVARIKEFEQADLFGFIREVLLCSLDFEHAKPFLKADATAEKWPVEGLALTDEAVKTEALKYLEFAWGKAEDHRGISANRSVQKLTQWIWLLGLDEVVKKIEAAPYAQYGAPILKIISEALGAPVPTSEPLLRMMQGDPCRPGCNEGCGL